MHDYTSAVTFFCHCRVLVYSKYNKRSFLFCKLFHVDFLSMPTNNYFAYLERAHGTYSLFQSLGEAWKYGLWRLKHEVFVKQETHLSKFGCNMHCICTFKFTLAAGAGVQGKAV